MNTAPSPTRGRRAERTALLASAFAGLFVLGFFLARPRSASPLVGTWTNAAGRLELRADGTGQADLPPLVNAEPVSWQETKAGESALQIGGGARRADGTTAPGFGTTATAQLREKNRRLTLSLPFAAIALTRTPTPAGAR